MNIWVLTLFPQIFESVFSQSIIARAIEKNIIKINIINIRDFAHDKHKTVDDTPYGGGSGMVMRFDILHEALTSIKPKPYIILLSASGRKYNQQKARGLAKRKSIALICGHYEGVDARIEDYVDEVISIGDFVLTGGEIAAMAVIDSVTRFIPESINPASSIDESFEKGLLEYPQYTRPEEFRGHKVPEVLLSGNHLKIEKWRSQAALKRTKKYRPDLLV